MSLNQDIVSAVKARLDGIPSMGTIHARNRYDSNWSTFLDDFASTLFGVKQVRGWVVTLDGTQPIVPSPEPPDRMGAITRVYSVLIVGLEGLTVATNSEQTLLDLAETVMDDLDGRADLGLTAVLDYGQRSLMRTHDVRMFGSVLCNYVEIVYPVVATKAVSYA